MKLNLNANVHLYHHTSKEIERLIVRIGAPTKRDNIGEGITHMATVVVIKDDEKVSVTYDAQTARNAAGNVSPMAEPITIEVQNDAEDVVSAAANEDGSLGLVITSEDVVDAVTVGQALVEVTLTGADGVVVTDAIAVTVTPSAAVAISGSVGTPEPR